MPAVLQRTPTTAFVEADEEFPIQSTGASAFAEDVPRYGQQTISESEASSVRWFIAILSSEVERLKKDVHQMVREIPRFQVFRHKLQQFLRASYQEKAAQSQGITDWICSCPVRSIYIHEVLLQCTTAAGPDGLDAAIDLLSAFGAETLAVFQSFLDKDRVRWRLASSANHINDDVGYVLLRVLARANVSLPKKLELIEECLVNGTNSLREAATHALGDMGGDVARKLLKQAADHDPNPLVRESAREALDDLDN